MITPGGISDNFTESDDPVAAKPGRSSLVKIVSVLTALAITVALLIGFLVWRKHQEERVAVEPQAKSGAAVRPALPTKVQVLMDEPVRKGPQAVISGTVHNVSNEPLSNLSLEVELAHRKDTGTERRTLSVEPKELAPDQKGRYSLSLTGDYRSIKLVTIKSGPASDEIGFKTAPGAARPVERVPEGKTIIVGKPSAPRQGEEFINTPDNPSRIP
ncbi:MAG TPA: FxLYD domain-containing protein [Pyrinomonadaceae bacterium]|nr:FxLYD domain-containing protein [Pyrinomonadaceae bacterium]